MNLAELRQNYTLQSLSETDVLPDPLAQFARWFDEARQGLLREPNAMTLATATPDGRPSARTVLLKSFDAEGFTFFTNYASRKGEELAANPRGALLFTWLELERQIRIEGLVEKISREESLAYFQSRPRESQVGAWASPQSRPVSRAEMETRQQALEAEYAGVETLPMPPSWGGYRLRPNWFEFWQGRPSRLHDRIVYQQSAAGGWEIGRLGA